jgi:hypothetical protein
MWRSGTLTDNRYKASFRRLEKWAQQAGRLDADASRGPVTARAVGIMRKLDQEIHKKTNQQKSLDDVVRLMVATGKKVNTENFRQSVIEVMGHKAESLSDAQLGLDSPGE